jgi:hypothetical protein
MAIEGNEVIEKLKAVYPCRDSQFSALSSVLGHPSFPSVPAIFLAGFPASGKSTITRAFLEAIHAKFVWVDCKETFTSALLFNRIVNKLRRLGGRELPSLKVPSDLNSFAIEVARALEGLKGKVVLVCIIAKVWVL